MKKLPAREEQVVITHAAFIRQIVETGRNPTRREEFETLLDFAVDHGWTNLVAAIRRIMAGEREQSLLIGLDRVTLTGIGHTAGRAQRSWGILMKGMILAAGRGNTEALKLISEMAEQMRRVGGPMARLAAAIRPLINGERDPQILCKGMDQKSEQMALAILAELRKGELN